MADDLEFQNNGYIPSAIPDGHSYELIFVRAEQASFRTQQKVYLWFRLNTPGEHLGQEFFMVCNVPPKGRWAASCKYWRMWVLAAGRRPARADRLNTAVFKNKVFRGRVRTVRKSANQSDLSPAQQYSVVDELLEVMVGR